MHSNKAAYQVDVEDAPQQPPGGITLQAVSCPARGQAAGAAALNLSSGLQRSSTKAV
jgi:hypothetical protein